MPKIRVITKVQVIQDVTFDDNYYPDMDLEEAINYELNQEVPEIFDGVSQSMEGSMEVERVLEGQMWPSELEGVSYSRQVVVLDN